MYIKFIGSQIIKYPYTADDIKKDNPNMSFGQVIEPETLALLGVAVVLRSDRPQVTDPEKKLVEADPIQLNGVWVQQWAVVGLDAEEFALLTAQKEAEIRNQRNALLSDSDWTMVSDAPLTDAQRAEWAQYRSALRNISQAPEFPFSVVFPQKPLYEQSSELVARPALIE